MKNKQYQTSDPSGSDNSETELKKLKARRAEFALNLTPGNEDLADNVKAYQIIDDTIHQIESEESRNGRSVKDRPKIAYDNQSILSTSSVRRKSSDDTIPTPKPNEGSQSLAYK